MCWCHDSPPTEERTRGANTAALVDLLWVATSRSAPGTARGAAASQGFPPPPRPPLGAAHRGKVFDPRKDGYFVPFPPHFPSWAGLSAAAQTTLWSPAQPPPPPPGPLRVHRSHERLEEGLAFPFFEACVAAGAVLFSPGQPSKRSWGWGLCNCRLGLQSLPEMPPASASSDMIRWGRVLLSHTLVVIRQCTCVLFGLSLGYDRHRSCVGVCVRNLDCFQTPDRRTRISAARVTRRSP